MGFEIVWVMKPRERKKCSQPLRGRNFIGAFEMVLGLGVFYVSHLRSFKFLEKKDVNMQIGF